MKAKLLEEVNEFLADENPEELADIQEVLLAIYDHKQLTKEDIEALRVAKERERGALKQRIIIDRVE